MRTRRIAALSLAILIALAARAGAQSPGESPLRSRAGFDERLDASSEVLPAVQIASPGVPLPIFVRLHVDWPALQRASAGAWTALDDRVGAYERASLQIVLAIEGQPPVGESETWARVIRAAADRFRGRISGYQIEFRRGQDRPSTAAYSFLLKLAAVQIRSVDPRAFIAQSTIGPSDAAFQAALFDDGTAPYVDVVAVRIGGSAPGQVVSLLSLIRARDASATILGIAGDIPASDQSAERWLEAVMEWTFDVPDSLAAMTFSASRETLTRVLPAAAQIKDLLSRDVLTIDDASMGLAISKGAGSTSLIRHRLLQNASSGATYLTIWEPGVSSTDEAPLTITLTDASGRRPAVRDPVRRQVSQVETFMWDPVARVSRIGINAPRSRPVVLDFNYDAPAANVNSAGVSATAAPDVADIVFRNQQAEAVQRQAFHTFVANLQIAIHFRPTAAQVFDVVSDNRVYWDGAAAEWEELSFSVNGARWGPDHPGLPLLQAEKVIALPLDLRLTTDYRYRLDGMETIAGHSCFVVAFDPVDDTQSSYRGRVWIDAQTYLRVRTDQVQTHLQGDIVSSADTVSYESIASVDGRSIYLPTRISSKQVLLIAGRNILLEKEQRFSEFHLDAADFSEQRTAARRSEHVMFRDTDAGVRYLVRRGDERVVSDRVTKVAKALAMGTLIDPSYDYPLPILGLNYLNFDLRHTGSQFALLFGGVFALGNVQKPRIAGTPFDASVDFFGFAVPSTDLQFAGGNEQRDERVMTIPESAGLNLGYQVTPFQKLSVGYVFKYDVYFTSPDAGADFVTPSSTPTHGLTAKYEFTRRGFQAAVSAGVFRRTSWQAWGPSGVNASSASYHRYSASVSKDFLLSPFQTVHAGMAWYGGARLDRFSAYQFGLFDEVRMHGVPGSGVKFSELALGRVSYSFNVFDIYRLDLFVDQAFGRIPSEGSTLHPVTGVGTAVTMKTPWNTMLNIDAGKSVLPAFYRGAGSFVIQIMLLKPLSSRP